MSNRRADLDCIRFVVLAAITLLLQSPVALHAGGVESYAMTHVSTGSDGGQERVTRWFVTPLKSRTEILPDKRRSRPAETVVVITRRDKGLAWTLLPAEKIYFERALDENELRALGMRFKSDLKIEELGREEVLGYDCDKRRIRHMREVGSRKVTSAQIVWQCGDFDVPLRIDGDDGSQTRTKELKVGPQPNRLFEVPRGYRKVEKPMGAMRAREKG